MIQFRRYLVLVSGLILVGGCGGSGSGGVFKTSVKVRGSGVLAEESRTVSGFLSVMHFTEGALNVDQVAPARSSQRFRTTVRAEDGSLQSEESTFIPEQLAQETLLVRAEDNLLTHLVTVVEGNVLKLRTKSGVDIQPTLPIEFFLTCTTLEGMTFKGVGSIRISNLSTNDFVLNCTGVGEVELLNLHATRLDVVRSGIGGVRATGNVDRQIVQLNGFGSYDADNLQSREAEVVVRGFGSATVRVSELLVAIVRSSGSIYYFGDPTVDFTITGTGTVERIGG